MEAEHTALDFGWVRLRVLSEIAEVTEAVRSDFALQVVQSGAGVGVLARRGERRAGVTSFHRVLDSGGPVLVRTRDAEETAQVVRLHLEQIALVTADVPSFRLRAIHDNERVILIPPGPVAEVGKFERALSREGWTFAVSTIVRIDPSTRQVAFVASDGPGTGDLVGLLLPGAPEALDPSLVLRAFADSLLVRPDSGIAAQLDVVPSVAAGCSTRPLAFDVPPTMLASALKQF